MACRDGFLKAGLGSNTVLLWPGPFLVKIWADFFGSKISHFWSVLEILSVVFNFLLSSTTVLHVDSDSEHESFQKISGKKFERRQGSTHGDENSWILWKIMILVKFHGEQIEPVKLISWGFQTLKFTGVLALRAMFKISASRRAPTTCGDFPWCWWINHELNGIDGF